MVPERIVVEIPVGILRGNSVKVHEESPGGILGSNFLWNFEYFF